VEKISPRGFLLNMTRSQDIHKHMNTWHDLIRAWGGPIAFAESIGVSQDAALQMSSRNNVHSRHWAVIVARAPHAGVDGITFELLASLRWGRQAKAQSMFRKRPQAEANQVAV